MGRRGFRLSVHRRNEERKKYNVTSLPISIELSHVVVFKVSIPCHLVEVPDLRIAFPLSSFTTSNAPSIQCLLDRLLRIGLPPHWVDATDSPPAHHLTLCKLQQQQPAGPVFVVFTLTVNEAFQWSLSFVHRNIDYLRDGVLTGTPLSLRTVDHILLLLSTLDSSRICIGNPEQIYLEAASRRMEHNASGEYT